MGNWHNINGEYYHEFKSNNDTYFCNFKVSIINNTKILQKVDVLLVDKIGRVATSILANEFNMMVSSWRVQFDAENEKKKFDDKIQLCHKIVKEYADCFSNKEDIMLMNNLITKDTIIEEYDVIFNPESMTYHKNITDDVYFRDSGNFTLYDILFLNYELIQNKYDLSSDIDVRKNINVPLDYLIENQCRIFKIKYIRDEIFKIQYKKEISEYDEGLINNIMDSVTSVLSVDSLKKLDIYNDLLDK